MPISSQDENNIVTTYRYNEAGLINQVSQTHEGTTLSHPLGYPDGWNALAYCGNQIVDNIDFAGALVSAIYSISQKKFVVWDYSSPKKVTVNNAISGDNIVSHQWLQNIGPLPLGEYTILNHGGGNDGWYELWKNDDGKFDDYTNGPGNVKRGNFRLHPGSTTKGCITLSPNSTNTQDALDLISHTATETIYPASNYFLQKTKYGKLLVIE